jgi:hypothetical protein
LNAAARDTALSNPKITLPDQPAECREAVPHAALRPDGEVRTALARERGQLKVANRRIADCAEFYDDVQANVGGQT